jgi:hypothetical protein
MPYRNRRSIALALDARRPEDRVLEYDGLVLLLIDRTAAELLDPLTLDLVETSNGLQLGVLRLD